MYNKTTTICDIISAIDCPHCTSTKIIKHGKEKGQQRYKCKVCHKTFRNTTLTPMHYLHKKGKVQIYLEALKKSLSVRKAASYAKISKNTSFAWRHKFLCSLSAQPIIAYNENICEAAIISHQYSAKGRKKEPEKNTQSSKTLIISHAGQISLQRLNNQQPTKDSIRTLTEICKNNYIIPAPHKTFSTCLKKTDTLRITQSKKLCSTVKLRMQKNEKKLNSWMKRFNGVATKYLQQYLKWYSTILNYTELQSSVHIFFKSCTSKRCIHEFRTLISQ